MSQTNAIAEQTTVIERKETKVARCQDAIMKQTAILTLLYLYVKCMNYIFVEKEISMEKFSKCFFILCGFETLGGGRNNCSSTEWKDDIATPNTK